MQPQKDKFSMRLLSVVETRFIIDDSRFQENNPDPEDMKICFSYNLNPDPENDKILLTFGVRYNIADDVTVLESVSAFSFEVIDLKNFIEKDDSGNMHVSSIVPHLINVAVGTMRGILLIKTSGTKLAGYPLPLVNVEELLARSERCPM